MNVLRENMRLIAECSQKLVRLGENLFAKGVADEETKPKDMGEELRKCKSDFKYWVDNYIILPDGYVFKDENGNLIYANKIISEKKKKEYPKTYKEAFDMLGYRCDHIMITNPPKDASQITKQEQRFMLLTIQFQKLLTCRDAYWKIAGEEMGLGEPWEPDWNNVSDKYCIYFVSGDAWLEKCQTRQCPFAFPTAEMRDAFYENFKELIEQCKELL